MGFGIPLGFNSLKRTKANAQPEVLSSMRIIVSHFPLPYQKSKATCKICGYQRVIVCCQVKKHSWGGFSLMAPLLKLGISYLCFHFSCLDTWQWFAGNWGIYPCWEVRAKTFLNIILLCVCAFNASKCEFKRKTTTFLSVSRLGLADLHSGRAVGLSIF